MPILTVSVTDVGTGKGVRHAGVYLFKGSLEWQSPENATYSGKTDGNGVAKFTVEVEVYGVGIVAKNYEAAEDAYKPPLEWRHIYACFGAVGVARDIDYPFHVKYVGKFRQWWDSLLTWQKLLIIASVIVGIPLIVGASTKIKKR